MIRRKSNRLATWDYREAAIYFVTICTHQRNHLFGTVRSARMLLNEFGGIAEQEWHRTASIRTDIVVDDFIVMPDHVHALIIILPRGTNRSDELSAAGLSMSNGIRGSVGNAVEEELRRAPLGAIVRGYKSAVTGRIRKRVPRIQRVWQPNYWDRVVRDETEWAARKGYMADNPRRWSEKYGSPTLSRIPPPRP